MKNRTVVVPHLGVNVQVQLIPPKLLRAIQMKAMRDGRVDFQELMVWKLVYGLRDPSLTEAEARRVTQRFTLRVLQPIVDEIDRLSGTDEHLRDCARPTAVRRVTEPMMMATAWLRRFPDTVAAKPRSRESHAPQPERRRGSRRGVRAASSSSDDPDPDPEPPIRRLCAFCNRDIPADRSPRARYCSDRHADRSRQRRKRERDRARAQLPRIPTTADVRRMYEITPEDVERLRAVAACRCNGRHLEFDPGSCFRCGHWLPRGVLA